MTTAAAISTASTSVFFGAKLFCDKVVTDIVSYRSIGDKGSFNCAYTHISITYGLQKLNVGLRQCR